MNWWGGVILQVRRAAYTACAASFFTLVAFLIIRSHDLQAPSAYHGVWLTLPAVDEGSARLASAELDEAQSEQRTDNETVADFVVGRALEGGSGTTMTSTEVASSQEGPA